jgi:ferrous-iron efflux pump FieF
MEMAQASSQQHGPLLRWASRASVAVAVALIAAKLAVWLVTDSVALLSSLIDSTLDAGASLVNLLAVSHALTPADREHRFGHGKAEPLAGLAQAAFISGSSVFLLFEAGHRLLTPRTVQHGELGVAVMILSIVATLGLVLFQRSVVRRTGSIAIAADSLHYKGDLLANLGVILALILSTRFGLTYADPLLAIAVAFYLLWGAWSISRQSLDQLMDRELPDERRSRIREIALAHAEVMDVHDLRTRASGLQTFIQLHLELDGAMALHRAHDIADAVELQIMQEFPGAEVIIHQDPAGLEEAHA